MRYHLTTSRPLKLELPNGQLLFVCKSFIKKWLQNNPKEITSERQLRIFLREAKSHNAISTQRSSQRNKETTNNLDTVAQQKTNSLAFRLTHIHHRKLVACKGTPLKPLLEQSNIPLLHMPNTPSRHISHKGVNYRKQHSYTYDGNNYHIFATPSPHKLQGPSPTMCAMMERLIGAYESAFHDDNLIKKVRNQLANNRALAPKIYFSMPIKTEHKVIDYIHIDRHRLESWRGRERAKSQSAVMNCISASDYAKNHGLIADSSHVRCRSAFEWCHKYAHSFGGIDGQNPQVAENLILGTSSFNTQMILFEMLVRLLVGRGYHVELRTESTQICNTAIATDFTYKIRYKMPGEAFHYLDIHLKPLEFGDPSLGEWQILLDLLGLQSNTVKALTFD